RTAHVHHVLERPVLATDPAEHAEPDRPGGDRQHGEWHRGGLLAGAGGHGDRHLPHAAGLPAAGTTDHRRHHAGGDQGMTRLEFPEGFVWGAPTAAYQIEGSPGGWRPATPATRRPTTPAATATTWRRWRRWGCPCTCSPSRGPGSSPAAR